MFNGLRVLEGLLGLNEVGCRVDVAPDLQAATGGVLQQPTFGNNLTVISYCAKKPD